MKQIITPDSLSILKHCYVEPFASTMRPGDYLQFQRIGYFMADPDTTDAHPVFNKTVGLKDTWAKKNK
jgi:glutaminyl-tRNA synthetase